MLSSRLYLPVPWQIRQINGVNVAEFKSNHTKVSLSVFPYSLYIFPLDYIVRHHGLEFHPRRRHPTLPALLCFKAHYSRATASLARIEACVSHVDSWLVRNKLKVNRGKTELLILNASHRPRPPIEAIQVSSERIMLVSSARNIGVVFDQEMTLVEHVTIIIFI